MMGSMDRGDGGSRAEQRPTEDSMVSPTIASPPNINLLMDGNDKEENEHFLQHHDDDDPSSRKYRPRRTLLLHIIFFILYVCFTAIVLFAYYPLHNSGIRMNTLTLNGEPLALRWQRFVLSEESPYAGPPREDIDQAWAQLLDHVNIRASDSELASSNQTSVQLPRGQGSLVWMDVSHQLHCVKYLRQWIYRDHYHPEVSPEETPHWLLHIDHCLDLLRQALMCRADTSPMTFRWAADRREPMLKLESPEHVCVDWEDLMGKVGSRRVSDADMAVLTNPNLEPDGM
ncbi:uncharacterized protein GGS22DRAFT_126826 [Annulohypoxylon maeteangense]|uniref:uncharacterized protein n=1 Tax=Annulohypoxylon maeteangense TaxID=1927788 RepID=UPI002008E59E|nr:uncharacterized protein GGS22DRAFT_126826 [Annulohypoxylon maeteangense]KAI0886276.1 hypothetical protein GGS22DRAFT_126826 [Annulohypoxylon maeteangense]